MDGMFEAVSSCTSDSERSMNFLGMGFIMDWGLGLQDSGNIALARGSGLSEIRGM